MVFQIEVYISHITRSVELLVIGVGSVTPRYQGLRFFWPFLHGNEMDTAVQSNVSVFKMKRGEGGIWSLSHKSKTSRNPQQICVHLLATSVQDDHL